MNADLAELVGYFMGDGIAPRPRAPLLRAAGGHRRRRAWFVAPWPPAVRPGGCRRPQQTGYVEVMPATPSGSTLWWEACGFAKHAPTDAHRGKGYEPHIPDTILYSNDPAAYRAFVRGLFEADGNINHGYASFSTVSERFSREVQTLLLALGFVTTRKIDEPGWSHLGNEPDPCPAAAQPEHRAAASSLRSRSSPSGKREALPLADHPPGGPLRPRAR